MCSSLCTGLLRPLNVHINTRALEHTYLKAKQFDIPRASVFFCICVDTGYSSPPLIITSLHS